MSKKKTKVNRQFLMDLANEIYDPKTRRFLRLCDGTLQNGPDPTNEKRPMHCGLGELYYAMTGNQPNEDGVSESDVVDTAVELSIFEGKAQRDLDAAKTAIDDLDISEEAKELLFMEIDDVDPNDIIDKGETEFRDALDAIPNKNDDGCGSTKGECKYEDFRSRSQRVAKQLRKAAMLLPE